MLGALLYLRLTSLRNLLRVRLQRLKQPKYLFGAIVGAAYFWFFFLRRALLPPTGGPGLRAVSPELQAMPMMIIAIPVVILGLKRVIEAWIAPDDKPGLAFTEAEVAFLFPAPLTRRMLVHFKLLGSQVTILLSSLLIALMASRWAGLGGSYLQHVVGVWVIFSTLNLHVTGAAFTVKRLIDGGVSKTRRKIAVTGVILLFLAVAGWTAWHTAIPPTPAESTNPLKFLQYIASLADHGVLFWLVLPFRIVLHPFLSRDGAEFLTALGPALLFLAAHYFWVVRAETTFEEASIALAEKRTALLASLKEGKYRLGGMAPPKAKRGPFRLASSGGRAEVAFLWKNLLSTNSYFRPRTFLIAALIIFAGCNWLALSPRPQAKLLSVTIIAAISAGYIAFFGPQFARQDLRSDLTHADILKSYPLHGWQVLLGELLTPVAILSSFLWLALLAVTLTIQVPQVTWLTPSLHLVGTVCIALIVPLVCALQLLIPNAAAVLFPGWMQATRSHHDRGIEMLGQRIIFVLGQMLVIILALLPAALGATALVFALQWLLGSAVAVALATLAVVVILAGEIWCGLWWLGQRFERLDLAAELRP